MSSKDEWADNEERLLREAGSLGELLERLKGLFSPRLIRGRGWEGLVERVGDLPPTLAGFPFWLGFPLDDSRRAAELGVSLVGGTRSAAFFENRGRSGDADRLTAAVASLLGETGPEAAPLRRVVGDRVLLEYDVDSMRHVRGDTGVFLYPVRPTLAGDRSGRRLRDLGLALDAMSAAAGRQPDAAERRHVERAYLALEPDARIGAVGAFPSRSSGTRLTMLGFTDAREVTSFLERAGWPGRTATVDAVLSRLQRRGALDHMHLGVHFEVHGSGMGPTLELQIFSQNRMYDQQGWFKEKGYWTSLLDGLREEGLADAGKLSELAAWSSGAKTLFGRSGPFLALQRIHHFKLVLTGDRIRQVNGYVFLLMCSWPPGGRPAGPASRRTPGGT